MKLWVEKFRVKKSLIGSPEKSVLTIQTISLYSYTIRYDVCFISPANVQLKTYFFEYPALLQTQALFLQGVLSISSPDFSQFNASTPQAVIFKQDIQNELAIT